MAQPGTKARPNQKKVPHQCQEALDITENVVQYTF